MTESPNNTFLHDICIVKLSIEHEDRDCIIYFHVDIVSGSHSILPGSNGNMGEEKTTAYMLGISTYDVIFNTHSHPTRINIIIFRRANWNSDELGHMLKPGNVYLFRVLLLFLPSIALRRIPCSSLGASQPQVSNSLHTPEHLGPLLVELSFPKLL